MSKSNQKLNRQRHKFLLTFFADQKKDKYAHRIVNNYLLIKQWNGTSGQWEVAIHSPKGSHCSKVSDKEQTTIPIPKDLPF